MVNDIEAFACCSCGCELFPVFNENSPYQLKDALWVGFFGGYGMFIDSVESELATFPSNYITGRADANAVLCKECAKSFVDSTPWAEKAIKSIN